MQTSRMVSGFIALMGLLLCGAHRAQAYCESLNDNPHHYCSNRCETYTCTHDIVNLFDYIDINPFEKHNIEQETVLLLTEIADVKATIYTLKSFSEYISIVEIVLTNSTLTELPSELLTLENLQYLEISGNNIQVINLNVLPYSKQLVSLNVSHNGIQEFETESASYTSTKQLKIIDLSHNEIERVPVNLFFSTRDSLEDLNLSHNKISTFDFYAFSSLILLQKLQLSHNKIISFGFILYPMRNLRFLDLSHNLIEEINAQTFAQSTSLKYLDLSFNNIKIIEDQLFGSLESLTKLSLSNNNISTIKEVSFRNNTDLTYIDLSYNKLRNIEPKSFSRMKNLDTLILNEAFTMSIQEHVLAGVKASQLNFAGSRIHKIGDRSFISIGSHLLSLNLSSCAIHEISEMAMDTLTELTQLDLSNNQLSEITFRTVDLKNLTNLNLRNNSIQELKPDTFEHLTSLKELDLTNNNLHTIRGMAFKNLQNLETFHVHFKELNSVLLSDTFYGLEKIERLDLVNTKVKRWDSSVFSGMRSLKMLNASNGQLTYIDYNALTDTGSIEILDLSNNQIRDVFNVKILPNSKLKKLYLNNNRISSFQKNLFDGLECLGSIDLSYNNLLTVESLAFTALKSLQFINLSHNPNLKLSGDVFESLKALDTVLLKNVSNQITFDSENVSIRNLDLSSSQISNMSLLHLHNIKNLVKLDLSHNNIAFLDQFSLGDLMHISSFTWLNLSHNNISVINPGTFIKTNSLLNLDLSHNKLDRIRFGAFSGLERLHRLDLSNNFLVTYKLSLLYDLPAVSIVLLDNNKIYNIVIKDNTYNLRKLSIGGNNLLCDDIIDLNRGIFTAEPLDYFTENVGGISCTSLEMRRLAHDSDDSIF